MTFFRRRISRAGLTTTRIEAFSDGVFAIAITLLILEIAIPELTHDEVAHGELLSHLISLWPKFLSFAISFIVISIFWVGHAIMFHFIQRSNRLLLWLNTLLLLSVSFIPFPAALIGEYAPDRAAVVLYGLTLSLAGLFFSLTWAYASYNRRLIHPRAPEHIVQLAQKVVWVAPLIYAFASILALIYPVASIIIFILVPLAYILPSPIDQIVDAAEEI